MFSPRWSPDGRYASAHSLDSSRVFLFDFQNRKWTEIANKGILGYENWSSDSKSLYILDVNGTATLFRFNIPSHQLERIADFKETPLIGYWGSSISIGADDSPLFLRDTSTQDVYSLDFQEQ
jgi:dipeptidyl aminopeptidase/acylaminoacyl peptidase